MIHLNLSLVNPFSDRWSSIWYKHGSLSKHKAWEFNGYKTNHIIDFDLHLTVKGDHAGFQIMLGLLGYATEFHFYDTRHWNYETDTWEIYYDGDH